MSMHSVMNARPLPREFEGEFWFPADYVFDLEDQIRGDLADKAALRGFMAEVRDLWKNIPERFRKSPWAQSANSFRKHALIKRGWCETDVMVFGSPEQAAKGALTMRYMSRMAHGYAITTQEGNVVYCNTPLSQSPSKMSKEDFQESKKDVIDYCHGVLGVVGSK